MKKIIIYLMSILLLANCSILNACTEKKCENCFGEGTIRCSTCKGRGKDLCTFCDGSENCYFCEGLGYKYVTCSTCNGRGKVVNPFTWQSFTCGACNGKLIQQEKCDTCYGGQECTFCQDGLEEYYENGINLGTKNCESCNGVGRLDCSSCEEIE